METTKPSSINIAIKWAVIYVITSIIITYAFQFLNIDQNSGMKYLSYIPFIAFLLLVQKEFKDLLGGYLTFGEGFMSGFLYSVFSGIMLAIFMYIYLSFLSPQILVQAMESQRDKFAQQGMSSDQIDTTIEMTKKYGAIIAVVATLIMTPIFGAIVALIGAAIFKKERPPIDFTQSADTYVDPTV
jgi:hypothetical protein